MNHPIGLLHNPSFLRPFDCHFEPFSSLPQPSRSSNNIVTEFWSCKRLHKVLGFGRCHQSKSGCMFGQLLYFTGNRHVHTKVKNNDTCDNLPLHVQTLRKFPMEKLYGEVAIVRFDSSLLLEQSSNHSRSVNSALSTIRYLHNAGAKILLISSWGQFNDSNLHSTEAFAEYLSTLLQIKVTPADFFSNHMQYKAKGFKKSSILLLDNLYKFREELTNCSVFARNLSSGAYIYVNDAFSMSHKILASTVGICRFCSACVAGFHFEEELSHLTKAREITRQPFFAIVGGREFLEKADALHLLTTTCDGLIFVGNLAIQIMHALGVSVPSFLLEHDASREAIKLIQLARRRSIPIYYPNDYWCANNCNPDHMEIFPSDGIMAGWTPVDLGPVSLKEICPLLSQCKKVLWIGPVKCKQTVQTTDGESKLASILERISNCGCEVIVVGNAACKAISKHSSPRSQCKIFKSASAVWELLKGRTLPGVAALDRAYPLELDWTTIFTNPMQPLIVDIGSGNGLFLLSMAKKWKHSKFLGLEINDKLVERCQQSILQSDVDNVYFISTNATFSFRSIISSYPGRLVLASIQCPNPDFNREAHRWRMVQRILVEAVVDLLTPDGKIFLQSDIKTVALRMKEQFLTCGKEKLVIEGGDDEGWLLENPFSVRSDWGQHVIDRGDTMYRATVAFLFSASSKYLNESYDAFKIFLGSYVIWGMKI